MKMRRGALRLTGAVAFALLRCGAAGPEGAKPATEAKPGPESKPAADTKPAERAKKKTDSGDK